MTYAFVVGHTLFTLSCSFVSICMLILIYIILAFFLTFVRLYGNIISVCR